MPFTLTSDAVELLHNTEAGDIDAGTAGHSRYGFDSSGNPAVYDASGVKSALGEINPVGEVLVPRTVLATDQATFSVVIPSNSYNQLSILVESYTNHTTADGLIIGLNGDTTNADYDSAYHRFLATAIQTFTYSGTQPGWYANYCAGCQIASGISSPRYMTLDIFNPNLDGPVADEVIGRWIAAQQLRSTAGNDGSAIGHGRYETVDPIDSIEISPILGSLLLATKTAITVRGMS